jgi:hypothetical protein
MPRSRAWYVFARPGIQHKFMTEDTIRMSSPTPRRSRISLIFGIVFLTVGLLTTLGSWRGYQLDAGILEHGARTQGHITKKVTVAAADGGHDHGLDYWFVLPEGQRIEAHSGVPKSLWESMREGDSLEIAYSPQYPRRNFPVGGGVNTLGLTMFVGAFGAVFVALGGLLIGGYVRAGRPAT